MTQHDGTFQRVSVSEAARTLGVSPSTVRRLVKAGRLTGERVLRAQGSAYVVSLPLDASTADGASPETSQPPRGAERSNASGALGAPPNPEQMMAAWSAAVLAPIVAELAASRETIREQAEALGSLRTQLAGAEDRIRALEAPKEPAPELLLPPPNGWPRWGWHVVAVSAIAVFLITIPGAVVALLLLRVLG